MKNKLLVSFLFCILSVILTYPLILNMDTALSDEGDPVLNTWILAWDVHQLLTSPGDLFSANIFYPHKSTLAYSEHLFASSLLALPVIAVTGKPILGYNVVFLLSFILAGFGMYCLVLYLTKNQFAGIVSGMIFAFCPYRFDHFAHLQLLTNHWMPFTFLYLHKFLDRVQPFVSPPPSPFPLPQGERIKVRGQKGNSYTINLLLFTLFFILQSLSCGYYAVFLSISVALMFLWFVFHSSSITSRMVTFLPSLLLFALIAGISIYPFYKPYAEVRGEMNFVRSLSDVKFYSAEFKNYLAASPSNHLYGRWANVFGDHEKKLFPGLLAVFLSIYGLLSLRKHDGLKFTSSKHQEADILGKAGVPRPRKSKASFATTGTPSPGSLSLVSSTIPRTESSAELKFPFIDLLIIISIIFGLFILISGRFSFQAGKFHFGAHRMTNPVMITVFLFIIRRFLFRRREPFPLCRFISTHIVFKSQRFYIFLLIFAFFLSLGPSFLLYPVLYRLIPPFQSLRVAARWAVMVMFSISVLAGFGVKRLFDILSVRSTDMHGFPTPHCGKGGLLWQGKLLCVVIPVLLIVEYSCFPLKFYIFPREVPKVYRWLSHQEGDFALVELPMPSSQGTVYRETRYMYWSTFHWKKLVNGYSGFFPPDYWEINKTMQEFPSEKSIALLRDLGVRYVIVHAGKFRRGKWWKMKEKLLYPSLISSSIADSRSALAGEGEAADVSCLRHVISFGTDHVYQIGKAQSGKGT